MASCAGRALARPSSWAFLTGDQSPSSVSCARVSTGAHASTSAATSVRLPLDHALAAGYRRHIAFPVRSRGVALLARRRGGGNRDDDYDSDRASSKGGGFQFSNRRGMYRVQYNEYEAEVRQDEAWKLAVPVVGGLVLAAAVIGPLIIGVAFTAITIGAALSAGALFTSLFLPFFLLIGAGALFFGGITFSAFATLGTALLLPKLISLAVVAGGLGLGAMAVSLFLKPAANRAKVTYEEPGRRNATGKQAGQRARQQEPELIVEAEEVTDPEVERQLREFDELLAGREDQRQKTDRFRAGGR